MQDFVHCMAPLCVKAILSAVVASFIFPLCSHIWALVIRSHFIPTPCGKLFNVIVRGNGA